MPLHEARHVAASHWVAAGLDPKRISTFLGHSSVSTTMDRYAHLLDGGEAQARDLLDAFHGYGMGTGRDAE